MRVWEHPLWTYVIFHRSKQVGLACLVSVLPDILSWGFYLMFIVITRAQPFGRPDLDIIPNWVFTLYGLTHSLFIVALVFASIYYIFRTIPVYLWAWPVHILMDIPLHRADYLPTPFLWPVSEYKFPGISFANTYFMIFNYAALLAAFGYIHRKKIAAWAREHRRGLLGK